MNKGRIKSKTKAKVTRTIFLYKIIKKIKKINAGRQNERKKEREKERKRKRRKKTKEKKDRKKNKFKNRKRGIKRMHFKGENKENEEKLNGMYSGESYST